MKNFLKTLSVIVSLSLFLTGCKKEDDKSSYVTIDGEKIVLETGLYSNYGLEEGVEGCYFRVDLLSPGVSVGETGSLIGSGKLFTFFVSSTSLIEIVSSEYEYNESFPFNSFGNASYNLNWDEDIPSEGQSIVSGVINIKNNNGDYEITIDCMDESGKSITGYFKGELICACIYK